MTTSYFFGSSTTAARTLVRHQLGALGATLVDLSVMVACVYVGLSAVRGTAFGAVCGAATSFVLGRRWIFPAGSNEHAYPQASKYALVSLGSVGLNAFGEFVVHDCAGVQFVLARSFVAALVGLGWNYPLQRAWGFAPSGRA
jgi:putative flippase GtrA